MIRTEKAASPAEPKATPLRLTLENNVGRLIVIGMNLFLLVFAITAIYPIIWMIYNSMKTSAEFAQNIFALPGSINLDNYNLIFSQPRIYTALFNSLFNAVLSTIGVIVLSFIIAYFLARYRFRGRNLLYAFFLFGLLVPIHGLLVPLFIQFKTIGMLNNRFTLLPPYIAFGLSTAIFLIESYIRAIPTEIEESAFIDGASLPALLIRVIFPICRPIIATVAILSFLGSWNEFAFALVLLRDDAYKPIPMWLNSFQGERTVNYTGLMAALTVASVPVIVIYLVFREKIMQGFISGALKG
jgi:raffinose/stachyose/melibiose transport system permease protein